MKYNKHLHIHFTHILIKPPLSMHLQIFTNSPNIERKSIIPAAFSRFRWNWEFVKMRFVSLRSRIYGIIYNSIWSSTHSFNYLTSNMVSKIKLQSRTFIIKLNSHCHNTSHPHVFTSHNAIIHSCPTQQMWWCHRILSIIYRFIRTWCVTMSMVAMCHKDSIRPK